MFTGVTGITKPRLILQVSKVRVMHVGVAESWQQEMLSMCLMSLPCPVTIQAGQEDEDLPS